MLGFVFLCFGRRMASPEGRGKMRPTCACDLMTAWRISDGLTENRFTGRPAPFASSSFTFGAVTTSRNKHGGDQLLECLFRTNQGRTQLLGLSALTPTSMPESSL